MIEWRVIPSFPLYEASSEGQIRRIGKQKPLVQVLRKKTREYLFVTPSINSKKTNRSVHSLVCEAFHGIAPTNKHHAAHWDNNPANNSENNLRWATAVENESDKRRHGSALIGSKHHRARFTEEEIAVIRQQYAELPRSPGGKVRNGFRRGLAEAWKINSVYLWHICNLNWRNVP